MPSTIEKKCLQCGKPITVRLADHKRGWGKFCSKSCKATRQERKTGQYVDYMRRKHSKAETIYDGIDDHPFSSDALGQS